MQVIDIRITPASDAGSMSRVCFIGEGGDEVAVTITDRHEGGSTIEQELVAKAKVMLLHAAAAQVRDVQATEPEAGLADDDDRGLDEDVGDDTAANPGDVSTNYAAEEDAGGGTREGRSEGPENRSGFGIDPLG